MTFIFIYLVIFGFAGSSCDSGGLLSSCGVPAQCDSSSRCRTWVLGYAGFCSCSSRALSTGSVVVLHSLVAPWNVASSQIRDLV